MRVKGGSKQEWGSGGWRRCKIVFVERKVRTFWEDYYLFVVVIVGWV